METKITITTDSKGALSMSVEGVSAPIIVLGILELAKASVSAKLTTPGQKPPSILMPVPNLNGK